MSILNPSKHIEICENWHHNTLYFQFSSLLFVFVIFYESFLTRAEVTRTVFVYSLLIKCDFAIQAFNLPILCKSPHTQQKHEIFSTVNYVPRMLR